MNSVARAPVKNATFQEWFQCVLPALMVLPSAAPMVPTPRSSLGEIPFSLWHAPSTNRRGVPPKKPLTQSVCGATIKYRTLLTGRKALRHALHSPKEIFAQN